MRGKDSQSLDSRQHMQRSSWTATTESAANAVAALQRPAGDHQRSQSSGSTVDTTTLMNNNSSSSAAVNKSPRGYRRPSTPVGLESSPLPPVPLAPLPEDESAPAIPRSSSPGTPPKKVWERSYRNFLKMRQGGNKQDNTNSSSSSNSNSRGRTSSLSAGPAAASDDNGGERESSIRGGKLFANVFRGGGSSNNGDSGGASPGGSSRRKGGKSRSSDDLDVAMRRGAEKSYSPGNSRYRPVVNVQTSSSLPHMMINNNSSSSSAAAVARGSVPGTVIIDDLHGTDCGGGAAAAAGVILRPRTSSKEDCSSSEQIQAALHMDAAATSASAARRNSPPLSTAPQPPLTTTPTVATAAAASYDNLQSNNNNNNRSNKSSVVTTPPSGARGGGGGVGIVADEGSSTSAKFSSAIKKAFTEFHNSSTTGRDAVSAYLGDDTSHNKRHIAQSVHSLAWTKNQQKLQLMNSSAVNSGSRCASQNNLMRHVPDGYNNVGGETGMMVAPTIPLSISSNDIIMAASANNVHKPLLNQGSGCIEDSPLETVFENGVAIHKELRVLKAVQTVDAWQTGRRYLIAPAALSACPTKVLQVLTGNKKEPLSAREACSRFELHGSSACAFGSILLGQCLMSCSGSSVKNHRQQSAAKKWSSALLVLRQNYLLEYSPGAPVSGMPRGYAHLQYAKCYTNADFPDALELHYYGSPCAKSDKRVLMIRVQRREERDDWKECLIRATELRVEDLYEFDKTKDQLAEGSYAAVCTARRKVGGTSDPPHCALKVFDKNKYWRAVVKGRERADTLVRETSVQATVTAKCGLLRSFVKIQGFFETADHVVIELELLEGTDLFNYISSKGVLKEADAAHLIHDVLQSLEAMNRCGLAHRDIKPANILMCQSEHSPACKVADFGMSTFIGVDGQVRGRCGTPGYVAPEIFSAGVHGGYGNKVDVFSAGVTLYVMLCGYEPFYGETDAELIEANKESRVEFPEDEWKGVSAPARDLVQKMMLPDPHKRPSAGEALKHPWFQTHLPGSSSFEEKITALPVSEAPLDDACIVS